MTKTALKLFVLRHRKGGAIVTDEQGNPVYYNDKQVAKNNRKGEQVVSLGPDHRRYKGEK